MPRSHRPRFALSRKSLRLTGLACGAVSIGVVGALLLGPSPVTPGVPPEQEPPDDSIVGKSYEDVATAELTGASGRVDGPDFVPRQVMIGFDRDATRFERTRAIASVDGELKRRLPIPGVVLIRLTGRLGVEAAQQEIASLPGVRYAEPNGIYRLDDSTPTDPYYPYLWGMENTGQEILGISGTPDADIDAAAAWDITKGSSEVVAAVVDTGVDLEHEDLAQQIWTNPRDPKNGIDDDRNGFIDDTNGWDFVNADARPDDDHYHGTHVADTIAARTDDGKGVVGVAPNSSIMPLKVLDSGGRGNSAAISSAFAYAGASGAKIANASLGGTGFSQTMLDSIKAYPNTLYVIAAGNSKADNETSPHYPCSYDPANIICVAATDSNDKLASFSNWGATRVDLAAPGVKILSDLPGIGDDTRKVLLSEDFEEPLPATWTSTGTADRWGVTDEKAYSGNGSLTDRPYENYRAGDAGRIYSPSFDLRGETECRWGMTGIWDPGAGDTGFNGRSGTISDNSGSQWSATVSNGNPGAFDHQGIGVHGGSAPGFRMFLELNAGSQANGGRGVFADDFWLTCANYSPDRTIAPSRYGYLNGTSMATPHVAGAVALLAAAAPQMSAQEMKDRILSSVDPVASLQGKMVSGGRLNVAKVLAPSASQQTSAAAGTRSGTDADKPTGTPRVDEPQPAETSLYGKGRHLPWANSDESDPEPPATNQEIVESYNRNNVPPSALLGQRTTTFGGHTMLNGQWGLDNGGQNSGTVDADIDAPEAWDTTRGSSRVTVALIGSGYPLNHPGLADNIAINPGESGGGRETNGLDDDRNGYIDDWRGLWTNSYAGGGRPEPQKSQPVADNHGQGTMAASLIAGDPSQGGRIFGISPETRILPIKVLGGPDFDLGRDPGEGASTDDLLEAIRYAGQMKADIAVLPVVGDNPDQVLGTVQAISAFPRTLFVAPTEMWQSKGPIPACRSGLDNLICVRASTRTDQLIYPSRSFPGIDLAAPSYAMVATDQEWQYREAANFDASDLPGTVSPATSPALAGAVAGEGMDGGGALAFSPGRDLPRGASAQIDFTEITRPEDVRSCGTTVRFSRTASLGQTIGIRSWADPLYRKYTTQRVTGRGRFTEFTSFWSGLMESASLGWLRKWSVFTSAPAESWTSRDLIDSFGYTCPKTAPSGDTLAWSGDNYKPEYYGLDAALVGGTASLLKAEHPGFNPAQLKRSLIEGSDSVPALTTMIPAGRRLNAAGALRAAAAIEPRADQPQVQVTSAPGATNDATPTVGFWSTNTVRLECGFESGASGTIDWTACSGSAEHTPVAPLADGAYTFRVRATGQLGSSVSDSAVITIDTLSPTAPTRGSASNTPTNLSSGYLSFDILGERDATFECRIEGINDWTNCGRVDRLADHSETRYYLFADGRDGAVDPNDGDFTFRARQIDRAGNVSSELAYPMTIDRTAPGPASLISSPAQTLRTNAAAFAWTREADSWATDIYLDDKKIGFMIGSPSGSRHTFRGLSDGPHVARFVVRDEANNSSDSVEYSFEVRTDPLIDTPVFDPSNPALTRSFPVIWFSGANGATYECSVDGAAFVSCSPPWTRSTTIYPTFRDGLHSLRIRQVVPSGDTGPVSEFVWTVDSTHPSAPALTSGPSGTIASKSASFSFTGERDATFQCRLDSTVWSDCVSGRSYDSLSEGPHTFELMQRDLAGNASSIVTRRWTVDTVAPNAPSISSGPSGPTSSRSAAFAFSGEAESSLQCKLDSGGWEACASGKSYASLPEGPHLFEVRQVDLAGNISAIATRTWTVDTIAPNAPAISSAPVGASNSRSASFTFTGEPGADFLCSLDGSGFSSCSSPLRYENLTEGLHVFEVKQLDAAGNEGPSLERRWTVDTTPPDAPTIDAGPSATTGLDAAIFRFSGEEAATFRCSLDEAEFEICSSPVSVLGLADGEHRFEVRQIDTVGNASEIATRIWTVDTTAAGAPQIVSAPDSIHDSDSAEFEFLGDANSAFGCSLDGSPFTECSSPASYSDLAQGSHTFTVRQIDPHDNVSPASSFEWTVDTVAPPSPSIDAGPSGLTQSRSASFGFSGEANATLECQLDSGAWSVCTSPKAFSSVSDGSHTFRVRQFDLAGNLSAESARAWTVDTTAPNLLRIRQTKRTLPYTFALTLSETESALSRIEFTSARTKPPTAAAPKTTYPLSGTTISLRLPAVPTFARVRDPAGNWSGWVSITK